MQGLSFERFGAVCAVVAGAAGLGYSLAGGLLSTAAFVALYGRLRPTDEGLALWGLVILNPKSPGLLTAAVLVGFVVNPVWFVWLGLELRGGRRL